MIRPGLFPFLHALLGVALCCMAATSRSEEQQGTPLVKVEIRDGKVIRFHELTGGEQPETHPVTGASGTDETAWEQRADHRELGSLRRNGAGEETVRRALVDAETGRLLGFRADADGETGGIFFGEPGNLTAEGQESALERLRSALDRLGIVPGSIADDRKEEALARELEMVGKENLPAGGGALETLLPDLRVENLQMTDSIGPSLLFSYSIRNAGTGSAPGRIINYAYLSVNTTITGADYWIHTWRVESSIPAGGLRTSGSLSVPVSGVPQGTYYLGIITDAGNSIPESNESNNTSCFRPRRVSIFPDGADLVLTTVQVTDSSGPGIAMRYGLQNRGNLSVRPVFMNHIVLSANTTITAADYLVGVHAPALTLLSGQSYTSPILSITVPYSVPAGTYYLGVILDGTNAVAEVNETNNAGYDASPRVSMPPPPDLVPTAITISDAVGPRIGFSFTVKNQGAGILTQDFQTGIYLSASPVIDPSQAFSIGTFFMTQDLLPGQSTTSPLISLQTSQVPAGTYYLGVMVDLNNSIQETNESNNVLTNSIQRVTVPNFVDIVANAVGLVDSIPPQIAFWYSTLNIGNTTVTADFTNDFFLSTDSSITTADIFVGSALQTANLVPGHAYASPVLTRILGRNVPDGVFWFGLIADRFNVVAESNEANNAWYDHDHRVTLAPVPPQSAGLTVEGADVPGSLSLAQNYPNPFNPKTDIRFQIPEYGYVSLKVFDLLGREVATLVNENRQPGVYSVAFDGSSLSSGTYFYRLTSGGTTQMKRMMLVK